jgi:hypothetical protein
VRRYILALLLLAGCTTACSETVTYTEQPGHCIEHTTHRIFALPIDNIERSIDGSCESPREQG